MATTMELHVRVDERQASSQSRATVGQARRTPSTRISDVVHELRVATDDGLVRPRSSLRGLFLVALASAITLSTHTPASALVVDDALERDLTFANGVCRPVTRTLSLPRTARAIRVVEPAVGDQVEGLEDTVASVTGVDVERRSGRPIVVVTATPEPSACTADPTTSAPGAWSDEGVGVVADVRFRRSVSVYVRGTGRGANPSIRPRRLPFGVRSTVVRLRWSRWGAGTAVGRGSVEFNPCVPDCARARPEYYPARVVLSRPRNCEEQYRYTRFSLRYTSSRRPSGLPPSYSETFGC